MNRPLLALPRSLALLALIAACAAADTPTSQPANDFARRLLRGDSSQTDALTRMLAAMKESSTALSERHDPGAETQRTQRAALEAIDELIETARRSQDDTKRQSTQARERRSPATVQPQPPRKPTERKPGDTRVATSQPAPGGKSDRAGVSAAIGETARRWGNLPARDRAELLQGLDEQMPVKYRAHIERYYRSLAEETPP